MRLFRSGKKKVEARKPEPKAAANGPATPAHEPSSRQGAPDAAAPEQTSGKLSEIPIEEPPLPEAPTLREQPSPSDAQPRDALESESETASAADGESAGEPSFTIRRRQPRKRKCLVLWSGDIDSTYTLVKLLNDAPHDVFAHHVTRKTRTPDGRQLSLLGKYETAAARRMRPLLVERFRAFGYSETAVDLSALPITTTQVVMELFFAAQAALSAGFTPDDMIFTSTNAEDAPPDERNMERHFRSSLDNLVNQRLVQSVMRSERTPALTMLTPPTRAAQNALLPSDILAMTVNCLEPNPIGEDRFEACGKCVRCESLSRAGLQPSDAADAGAV